MTPTHTAARNLIPLTGVSPRAALAAARSLLAARPGPADASIAHQAAAIVLRDFGDVHAAIREFRLAARLARAAAEPGREADVLTSLGTALVMAGRTEAGLAALDDTLARARRAGDQAAAGRILVRRGGSLHIAGRYEQARADLREAIALTRRAGEVLWEARARTAAALADLALGATGRAEAGFGAAEALFAGTGQRLEIAYARHNRALVAFAAGDLPGALRHLDDAAARYAALGVAVPDAALDRCTVLLAAGLPRDALAHLEKALADRITPTKRAELQLAAARTALAAGRYDQGAERALVSRSMFTAQRRDWWRNHATLVLIQARFLAGHPPGRLLPEARRTAGYPRSPVPRAGWPRRCGPSRAVTGGGCWRPAAGGSACSRSTWPRWAQPSSGRTPPGTAPSWPGWPSGPRCAPGARACCWNGASGGAPSPWAAGPSPRAIPPRGPSWPPCAT